MLARSATEQAVASIWAALFGVDQVGRDDDFFELGGDSLSAMRCVARIDEEMGIEISLRAVFEHSSVAAFSRVIDETASGSRAEIRSRATEQLSGQPLAVSFNQEERLIRDWKEPPPADGHAHNLAYAFHVVGRLDVDSLERSVNSVVRRHAALRTVFAPAEAQPVQVVEPFTPFPLRIVDVSHVAQTCRLDTALAEAEREAAEPFDLTGGRLLRGTVVRLADNEYVTVLTLEHLVGDGWSIRVLADELGSFYRQYAGGEVAVRGELPIQFADFVAWERRWLRDERLKRLLGYWNGILSSSGPMPEVHLPFALGGPQSGLDRREALLSLSPELSKRVREFAAGRRVTVVMTALAALQVVTHLYVGGDTVHVFSHVANRGRRETQGLIGWFANRIVLGAALGDNPTVEELMRRVRETVLGAEAHGELPFPKLLASLYPEWYAKHVSVPYIRFADAEPLAPIGEFPSARLTPLAVRAGRSEAALTVSVLHRDDSIELSVSFLANRFERPDVEFFLSQIACALEHLIGDQSRTLAEVESKLENLRGP